MPVAWKHFWSLDTPGSVRSPLALSYSTPLILSSGKTVFFAWLLIRRLVLGLPTAMQFRDGLALLFHEKGTSRFIHLNVVRYFKLTSPHRSPGRIWVLVDAGRFLSEPAPIFIKAGPFFTVETVSPNRSSFKTQVGQSPRRCRLFFYIFPAVRIWGFCMVALSKNTNFDTCTTPTERHSGI